jgi:succinyl-CoA synthetase alpha subunit
METTQEFFPGCYRDSVALMMLSSRLSQREGVESASAQMATAANIDLMVQAGLLGQAVPPRPNDLWIVVRSQTPEQGREALAFAQAALVEKRSEGESARGEPPRSIEMALAESPEANVVLISTPGEYAGAEALKALKQGCNVMMFSDNVPVEQEVLLKTYASEHELLVMGPDCGTAILGGVPLAFANAVARGPVGVVGASGTGIQQVTSLIDRAGLGISHAIGTGGHDLSLEVGGLTMLSAMNLLERDPQTKVVVLLSKPPAEAVARHILAVAQTLTKPVVVCFLGAGPREPEGNLVFATTLENAAQAAARILGRAVPSREARSAADRLRVEPLRSRRVHGGVLRGLYTGGTFCYEAQVLLRDVLPGLSSNTPTSGVAKMADLWNSRGHTILDLGDDDFTRGRPHPMIDPATRNERLLKEARDPETAVLLFDVVLGYGSHDNPAGGLVAAIVQARAEAQQAGRDLAFVGFLCGTDRDPQGYRQQESDLANAGVLLAESNAHAAELIRALFTA